MQRYIFFTSITKKIIPLQKYFYQSKLSMIISKKVVVLFGIGCLFFLAFLNRVSVLQKTEMINAYAERLLENEGSPYLLSFIYKEKPYRYVIENDVYLKNKSACRLLIKNENPANFIVFNFMNFWLVALMVFGSFVLLWLLFVQVFFANVIHFKFYFWKKN